MQNNNSLGLEKQNNSDNNEQSEKYKNPPGSIKEGVGVGIGGGTFIMLITITLPENSMLKKILTVLSPSISAGIGILSLYVKNYFLEMFNEWEKQRKSVKNFKKMEKQLIKMLKNKKISEEERQKYQQTLERLRSTFIETGCEKALKIIKNEHST